MRGSRVLLVIAILVGALVPAWGADEFVIDPVHSSIEFSVRHMMVTNVRGRFREFSGTIVYDEKDITKSSVRVTIKTASIDTGNADRDNHLRSPDFFDAAKYPEITFVSTRIEKRGDDYVCIGTLTMRGVSREVAIPFRILGVVRDPRGNTRLGVEAGLTINRLDYGVSWSRALEGGGLVVGNDVKIELNVQAIKRAAPAASR
ncbi:MAG: YceI family protein [Blastocatellia bacterium]|nr:YceI family protein [Blastocatellia bacterium]MCS7156794.1 YceI family protein [Blastocatellia bacterium]MCX7752752.1 YceI family protein [Blastocatellia bacterium]MDW8167485.1 YceI family protein [Acidobacteriota bacterium]MDW8256832.1 YceI family protein [Acidobacteriota bacterium]